MRAIFGCIALHSALAATGLAVLRALGLVPLRINCRIVGQALVPALLVGLALVVSSLIVLLVIGIPLTLISAAVACFGWAGIAELVARRRAILTARHNWLRSVPSRIPNGVSWLPRLGIVVVGAYFVTGAFVLARLPTSGDDARIWSLRGLTLTYYHGLQPEVFQNQLQSGAHPIYPLFQPALEALLFQAMGRPQLRFLHSELWLVFAAAVWTAGYLLARGGARIGRSALVWLAPLALLSLTPAAIEATLYGWADITGSVVLAVGALGLALWIKRGEVGFLAVAAVMLVAGANTKDEDLVAAVLLLVIGTLASIIRYRHDVITTSRRLRLLLLGTPWLYFAMFVLPWRVWTIVHHLSDSVEPPLPQAISPTYILNRTHELRQSVNAMLTQTLTHWGWLAAIFIVACLISVIGSAQRRLALFYLASVAAIVISLLWLYTTTPLSLDFLLPTTMYRTVDLFMVLAGIATAHLLAEMTSGHLARC